MLWIASPRHRGQRDGEGASSRQSSGRLRHAGKMGVRSKGGKDDRNGPARPPMYRSPRGYLLPTPPVSAPASRPSKGKNAPGGSATLPSWLCAGLRLPRGREVIAGIKRPR